MHPIAFTLPGGFSIHTYGIMVGLGILTVATLSSRIGERQGLPKDAFWDLYFWMCLGGLIGSRLEYVRVNFERFNGDFGAMLNVRDGGLVFYGGLVGGLIALLLAVRARGLPALKVLDIVAVAVPTMHVLGRLGCFAAGCCYGHETDVPWAVTFTDPHAVAPLNVPLHPTQLYEAAYNSVLALGLYWMVGHKRRDGQVILTYLAVYPVLRSINEEFRGDGQRGYFLEGLLGQALTNAQFISLVLAVVAAVGFVLLMRSKAPRGSARA